MQSIKAQQKDALNYFPLPQKIVSDLSGIQEKKEKKESCIPSSKD